MPHLSGEIETVPPFVSPKNIQHVAPVNDDREHIHDSRGQCWCKPAIEIGADGSWHVIHNHADNRTRAARAMF